jgi:hypothetical protein
MVRYGSVRFGTVQYSLVRFGTVWYGLVRFGTVRYSSVRFSTVRYGSVRFGILILKNETMTIQSNFEKNENLSNFSFMVKRVVTSHEETSMLKYFW